MFLAGFLACLTNAQGQTWKQIGNLPPGTDLRCAYFWDTSNGVVGGVHCIYTYTSGAWRTSTFPEEPDTIKSLRLLDGFSLYAASGATCIWKSSDHGASWQKTTALLPYADDINYGIDGLIHGINLRGTGMDTGTTIAHFIPYNEGVCIKACDDVKRIALSGVGGVSWDTNFPLSFRCGYSCSADTCTAICYILSDDTPTVLYRTTDEGADWEPEYNFDRSARDILEGGDCGVLYVQGIHNVWRSISGGKTWENIGGPGSNLEDRRMFSFGQYNRYLIEMDSAAVWFWDGGPNYVPTGPMPKILNVSNVVDTNCTFPQLTVNLALLDYPDTIRIHAFPADSSTIQPTDTAIILPAGSGSMPVQFRTSVPYQQFGSAFYFQDTLSGIYHCGQYLYSEDTFITVQMPSYPTNILRASDVTDTACSLSQLTVFLAETTNPDTVRIHAYTDDGLLLEPSDTMLIVPIGKGLFPMQYQASAHPFQFASTFHFEDTVSGEYKCGTYKYVTDSSILVHLYPPPGTPRCWLKTPLKYDACTQTRIPLVVRAPNICDSLTIDSITWSNNSLSFQFDHLPPETLGPNGFDTFWVALSTPVPGINNNYFYVHTTSTVLPRPWDTALYLYALASPSPSPPRATAPVKLTLSNCAPSVVPFYLHALLCDSVEFTACTLSLSTPILYATNFNFPLNLAPGTDDTMLITFPPQGYAGVNLVTVQLKGKYVGSQVTFDTTVQIRVTFTNAASALVPNAQAIDFGTINLCDGSGEGDTSVTFTNLGCDTIIVTGDKTFWQSGWSVTDPSFPDTLPPKDTFAALIHFDPTGPAFVNLTANYGFEYEGGKAGTAQIALTGQAIVAGMTSIAMNIPSVNFGTFSQCRNPVADTTITITNTGCDSLSLNVLVDGGSGFTLVNGTDTTLGPNQSETYAIHFAGSVAGSLNSTFHITAIGVHGGSMIDTTVSLTAVITPATRLASINITSIDFGATSICEERDSSVTITNAGCEPDTIISGSFSSTQFSFDTVYQFPIVIPPGNSITFPIFTHLDTTGHPATINGTLNFTLGSGVSVPAVTLTRAVTYPGAFSLSLASEASAPIRAIVPVYVMRAGTVPSQANEIDFDLIYNDNLLGDGAAMQPDIKLVSQTRLANGLLDQAIAMQPASDRDTIATLLFQTYLTKNDSTGIQLAHQQFFVSGSLPEDCIASMDTTSSPSNFSLELACGDSIILADWNSAPPFSIESIQPNPAGDEITVQLSGNVQPSIAMYDALGRSVPVPPTTPQPPPIPLRFIGGGVELNVSGVPSGIYYLRFSSEGYVQTRRISVER